MAFLFRFNFEFIFLLLLPREIMLFQHEDELQWIFKSFFFVDPIRNVKERLSLNAILFNLEAILATETIHNCKFDAETFQSSICWKVM